MKKFLVAFTANNARIIKTPELIEALVGLPGCYLQPDLRYVKGVPPQHWKVVDGNIVPMTEQEKLERDVDIALNGALNDLVMLPTAELVIPEEPQIAPSEPVVETPAPAPVPQPPAELSVERPKALTPYIALLMLIVVSILIAFHLYHK